MKLRAEPQPDVRGTALALGYWFFSFRRGRAGFLARDSIQQWPRDGSTLRLLDLA
jgi:hypothetical protein